MIDFRTSDSLEIFLYNSILQIKRTMQKKIQRILILQKFYEIILNQMRPSVSIEKKKLVTYTNHDFTVGCFILRQLFQSHNLWITKIKLFRINNQN